MKNSVFFAVTVLAAAAGTAAQAQTMVESGALTSRAAMPAMTAPAMNVPAPAMSPPPTGAPTAPATMPAQRVTVPYTGPGMPRAPMTGLASPAQPLQPPASTEPPAAPEHPLSPAEMAQMARDLPLFQAAYNGDTPAVRRALAKGARVNSADWQYGFTPLMWASLRGKLGAVRYLLAHGARPNVYSRGGISITLALGKTITTRDNANGQNGVTTLTPLIGTPNGYATALMAAAANGYNLTVRELLRRGANPNYVKPGGVTPLILAAFSGNLSSIEALLAHGANVNAVDSTGAPALQPAAATGNLAVIRLLLHHGADPTTEGSVLRVRPGTEARLMGHPEAARVLEAAARDWKPRPVHVAPKPAAKAPAPRADDDDDVTILN